MIYLLDKPRGWTSFDLVKKVRNITGEKAGHAGTLDPLATGLMIVATGADTKKLHKLIGLDKMYVTEFLLGRQTDTADQEGRVTGQLVTDDLQHISKEQIQQTVKKLAGTHKLPVPLYSAVKVNGRPLYWYARNNKPTPEIPVRDMVVHESRLLDIQPHEYGALVFVELSVASGVYIRSLAEYFGEQLGVPSMMWSLRRTKIGDYDISQAITVKQFTNNHNT